MKQTIPDLSNTGPYATADDALFAAELGISIEKLRTDRYEDDKE